MSDPDETLGDPPVAHQGDRPVVTTDKVDPELEGTRTAGGHLDASDLPTGADAQDEADPASGDVSLDPRA